MKEKVQMEFTRSEIFTLFNSLLVREKSVFNRQNEEWIELLNRLWNETADRTKYEVLWHKNFRDILEKWKVSYKNDLIRLEVPEILEDEENN